MSAIPKGGTAVMARRVEPPDSLEFFPTPPWATRALFECVLIPRGCLRLRHQQSCAWEPAAGEGHMAEVLREYIGDVHASDVHGYGRGYAVGSFVGEGPDRAQCPFRPAWVITNPPFEPAQEFALRALEEATYGVAIFARSNWSEGKRRYEAIFGPHPPAFECQFVERVPLVKGRWDPEASTATSYSWFVWLRDATPDTFKVWIPPGQRRRLERVDDRRRFAPPPAMPLFPEAAG